VVSRIIYGFIKPSRVKHSRTYQAGFDASLGQVDPPRVFRPAGGLANRCVEPAAPPDPPHQRQDQAFIAKYCGEFRWLRVEGTFAAERIKVDARNYFLLRAGPKPQLARLR